MLSSTMYLNPLMEVFSQKYLKDLLISRIRFLGCDDFDLDILKIDFNYPRVKNVSKKSKTKLKYGRSVDVSQGVE